MKVISFKFYSKSDTHQWKKKADFTWPFECADDKNLFPLRPTHPIREIDDVRNGSAEHDNIDVICN